jgi:hypothetical protein
MDNWLWILVATPFVLFIADSVIGILLVGRRYRRGR